MKGLMIKECYMLWKQAKFVIFLVLLYVVIGAASTNGFWISFSILFVSTLPVTSIGLDERSKWDKYVAMLPCSRKDIVLSKYVVGIVASTTLVVLYSILSIIVMAVRGDGIQWTKILQTILPLIASACILMGTNLPIIFKMGSEKGRMWIMLSLVLVMAGAMSITSIMNDAEGKNIITSIMNGNESGLMVSALFFLIGIFFLVGSIFLSIRIFEKKEL